MKSFLSYAWVLSMFARNTEKIETNLTATYFLTAQVHLYQLCEYKRMMHQAMHNILQKRNIFVPASSWSELMSRNSFI